MRVVQVVGPLAEPIFGCMDGDGRGTVKPTALDTRAQERAAKKERKRGEAKKED